jgi:hypothetical protein
MTTSFDLAAAALRRLDEDLTRGVILPPVDSVIRRADAMNRTTTAATAAVLTVGALGAVTVVAQSVVSGAVPMPVPVALAPAPPPALADPSAPQPVVADVLNPGERLVRLNPGVAAPAGSRLAAHGTTVVGRNVAVNATDGEEVKPSKRNDNEDSKNNNNNNEDNNPHHNNGGHHNNPPKDNPPKDNLPQDNPPKDNPPKDNPPKDNPPKDNPPQDNLPQDNPPQDNPPQDNPPQDNPPKDNPPKDNPPKIHLPKVHPPKGAIDGTTLNSDSQGKTTDAVGPKVTVDEKPNLIANPTTPKIFRRTPPVNATAPKLRQAKIKPQTSAQTPSPQQQIRQQIQQRVQQQQQKLPQAKNQPFKAPTQRRRTQPSSESSGDQPRVTPKVRRGGTWSGLAGNTGTPGTSTTTGTPVTGEGRPWFRGRG